MKNNVITMHVMGAVGLVIFVLLLLVSGPPNFTQQHCVIITTSASKVSDVDPSSPAISQFGLSIPTIGVSAPVIPNVDGTSKEIYDEALNNGVSHFAGTSLPGGGGNIFMFGHSSTILGLGEYDHVFARLPELEPGDEIDIYFNGRTYVYRVTEKKIVSADDTSVLQPTSSEQLSLMTCWPVGTDQQRMVVISKP